MSQLSARLREHRLTAGMSQAEVADRAAVSRAMVSALEQGRHMPAADAAIRIARALDTTVERLFDPRSLDPLVDAVPVLGGRLPDGALVRTALVDERLVARVYDGPSALSALADGVAQEGRVRLFAGAAPGGVVIAGCDPVLGVVEGLLERAGLARVVAVPATSGEALGALEAGRCHGVLVHGPAPSLHGGPGLQRWHIGRWRTGIATHPQLARPSVEALLSPDMPMIGRERSAACQQAVERAARRLGAPRPTPPRTVGGHLEAARAAAEHHAAAITIEPVALAMDLDFYELELHDVELWVPDAWSDLPGIRALLDLVSTARFRDRAAAVPAYDLTDTGAPR